MATQEQIQATLRTVQAIAEAIREVKRIPSGHLYALVMDKMCLDTYQAIIATLVRTRVVKEVNHELIWIEKEQS